MKNIIGIDPGCSGAIVVLSHTLFPIEWTRTPTMIVGKNTRVNAAELAAFLRPFSENSVVYMEQVGAMPGQGVTGMFNFGHATGTVTGVLAALGMQITLVTPQLWKKNAGLIGTDKDAARSRAIMLWPDWRDLDKKGQGQAFADAALIARFGDKNQTY